MYGGELDGTHSSKAQAGTALAEDGRWVFSLSSLSLPVSFLPSTNTEHLFHMLPTPSVINNKQH